jgi:phosphatidyl-myo-inositol dimannoside synthase
VGAHHIIADCHFTARYVEAAGHRTKGSTAVVWDCVDLTKFSPGSPSRAVLSKYGIPDPTTGFNLLTLGRMSPDAAHKGYERLLEVFSRLAAREPSLRLIYAGRGALVDALRARAASLGLSHRVFFTGMVNEADMADVYRSAHMFSLVSDRGVGRGEGIPLTPLEAAACGAPILVGNQDGSAEAVVAETNGFVLDPFDLDKHVEKVSLLVRDEALRAQMAEASVAVARREFSYERFKDKHRDLLQSWFSNRIGD